MKKTIEFTGAKGNPCVPKFEKSYEDKTWHARQFMKKPSLKVERGDDDDFYDQTRQDDNDGISK